MGPTVDMLARAMSEAFHEMRGRVQGMTDEEYFWEPVEGCWRVYRRADGRWDHDYEEPDPDPAPFTTIGWRLAHIATCKVMYHEYAFGPRMLTWDTIETPGTADDALDMLDAGHALLTEDLSGLDDPDLDEPALTDWGEERPTWWIFSTMTHHDAHHGGELGVLRDLYRLTHGEHVHGSG